MLSFPFTGFLGGQGQDATALCIKHRDLAVKQGESSLSVWAGLDRVPVISSAPGMEQDWSAGVLALSCTLAVTMKRAEM